MANADIGLIGLAVMGENLVLNMASKGFTVAVFNRNTDKVDNFVNGRGKDKTVIGCHTIKDLVANLKAPRKVMIMVRAGEAVDRVIEQVAEHLAPGDIIIDGGNSHFPDSNRRYETLTKQGLHFIGAGVSGGEEGALKGPSIMPGGSIEAWEAVKPIFQTISAKVEDGSPCCEWVGDAGAGHFVKMVHNGIEYGDMQLICEGYHVMRDMLGLSNDQLQTVFTEWNTGKLDSYLIEITSNIFKKIDDETGKHVVDLVLDRAGQKGTGKWTAVTALDLGMPLTLIGESVFSRCLSALKDERVEASKVLTGPEPKYTGDVDAFIDDVRDALYCSKVVSYAQGFTLMAAAAEEFGWKLNYGSIALMWRGGCIIRSKFLANIKEAFDNNGELSNLLLDQYFEQSINEAQTAWRRVVARAAEHGIPVPAFSSALCYFDGYRLANLPANLLQAQRDYFGAHTYERVDKPSGEHFHTDWTGEGGATASTIYDV